MFRGLAMATAAAAVLAGCGQDARERTFAHFEEAPPARWQPYAAEVAPVLQSAARTWFDDPTAEVRVFGLKRLGGVCGIAHTKWGRWIVRLDGASMTAEHWEDVSVSGGDMQCESFREVGLEDLAAQRKLAPGDLASVTAPGGPSKWGYKSASGIMRDISERRRNAESASYQGLAAMKASLRDPSTAEISGQQFGPDGAICGYVNAANGFGGKTGAQRFIANGPSYVLEEQVDPSTMNQLWAKDCPL